MKETSPKETSSSSSSDSEGEQIFSNSSYTTNSRSSDNNLGNLKYHLDNLHLSKKHIKENVKKNKREPHDVNPLLSHDLDSKIACLLQKFNKNSKLSEQNQPIKFTLKKDSVELNKKELSKKEKEKNQSEQEVFEAFQTKVTSKQVSLPSQFEINVYCVVNSNYNQSSRPFKKRCSSLKGSRACLYGENYHYLKKSVTFADSVGLDLECVRHVLNTDEPPTIPAEALLDLRVATYPGNDDLMPLTPTFFSGDSQEEEQYLIPEFKKCLILCFSPPGLLLNFQQLVLEKKVLLESCLTNNLDLSIHGLIRVANISYKKYVFLRYSWDVWKTHADLEATFAVQSVSHVTDAFYYQLKIPYYMEFGVCSTQFCVGCVMDCVTYWDNNYGSNYTIECQTLKQF